MSLSLILSHTLSHTRSQKNQDRVVEELQASLDQLRRESDNKIQILQKENEEASRKKETKKKNHLQGVDFMFKLRCLSFWFIYCATVH